MVAVQKTKKVAAAAGRPGARRKTMGAASDSKTKVQVTVQVTGWELPPTFRGMMGAPSGGLNIKWELPCWELPHAVGGGLGPPIGGLNIGWELPHEFSPSTQVIQPSHSALPELPAQGSNCHAAQQSEGGPQQRSNCPTLPPTTNLTVLQCSDPTMLPSWDPITVQKGSNQRRTLRPQAPTITLHALNTRAARGAKYSFFWQKGPQTPQVEVGAPISGHLRWELPANFFGSACGGWELPPTYTYIWRLPPKWDFPIPWWALWASYSNRPIGPLGYLNKVA
ncbi:hypothetical protein C8J57DRAFT_1558571 [Mycena rebaudengoi]|nr:hypothetical protein C8J57DRAFT_1558571 [Mycena rebaudengoi]